VPGCATTVRTALNVFSRRDGQIRHAYCTELLLQMNDDDVTERLPRSSIRLLYK
jgi:hypothetical protein